MPVRRHPMAASRSDRSLAKVPIDRALIERLKSTYAKVRTHDARLAEIFYARLFAAAPHLRALFKSAPEDQARKLMASLDAVVRNLEHPIENAAMLAELGERHAGYGAKPEHYELVVDLLVRSMREVLGHDADDRGLEEWRMALALISRQMIAGAQGAGPSARPTK